LKSEYIAQVLGHAQQIQDQLLKWFLLQVEDQAELEFHGPTLDQVVAAQDNLLKDG
jgi:hypothetical protein